MDWYNSLKIKWLLCVLKQGMDDFMFINMIFDC